MVAFNAMLAGAILLQHRDRRPAADGSRFDARMYSSPLVDASGSRSAG